MEGVRLRVVTIAGKSLGSDARMSEDHKEGGIRVPIMIGIVVVCEDDLNGGAGGPRTLLGFGL